MTMVMEAYEPKAKKLSAKEAEQRERRAVEKTQLIEEREARRPELIASFDIDLLTQTAAKAARIASGQWTQHREDCESTIIETALAKAHHLERYLHPDSELPEGERRAKLLTTFIRYGKSYMTNAWAIGKAEAIGLDSVIGLIEEGEDPMGSILFAPTHRPMTPAETIACLMFVWAEDIEVPEDISERVSIVRNTIMNLPKTQQVVAKGVSAGKDWAEISAELGIHKDAVKKRWQRINLFERINVPIYAGHRTSRR